MDNKILEIFIPGPAGRLEAKYYKSKKPSEIKLNNIFDAIDESVKTVQCKKESKKSCNGKSSKCVTHDLWNELETHINSFFEQKSLEDLVSKKESRI